MNKIHNALGCPGSFTFSDLHCEKQPTGGEKWIISVSSSSLNSKAIEIWNRYFTLIFNSYKLPKRLIKYKKQLEATANPLYKDLFSNTGNINISNLIELLLINPNKYTEPSDYASIADKNVISAIFNYTYLTQHYKEDFIALILLLNVNVCPYCGRAFTTTVEKSDKHYIRTNEIDHYLPQDSYPWLSLSIWNWIPVCGSCNLHKSSKKEPFLYPYEEEMGDIYRFATHSTRGMDYLVGAINSEDNFDIVLEPTVDTSTLPKEYNDHIQNEVTTIGTKELYSSHKDYVCNIFRQRYIYGNPFIERLTKLDLFNSKEDVLAMMYFKRIDAESIGNSPLDKLTRDINHEIDVLQEEDKISIINSKYAVQLIEINHRKT